MTRKGQRMQRLFHFNLCIDPFSFEKFSTVYFVSNTLALWNIATGIKGPGSKKQHIETKLL